MNTAEDIQKHIFDTTGIKTSVKKPKGSMKGYTQIWPIFQNGQYTYFPHEYITSLRPLLAHLSKGSIKCNIISIQDICIYDLPDGNIINFKKERKPKPIDPNSPQKGWGSKNSQMRLDKTVSRNAAKMRRPGYNGPSYM